MTSDRVAVGVDATPDGWVAVPEGTAGPTAGDSVDVEDWDYLP
mgnify:CR=1 FL=1